MIIKTCLYFVYKYMVTSMPLRTTVILNQATCGHVFILQQQQQHLVNFLANFSR